MKNLRIIIPAGVCAIIGIVAVVMLTKGSGEKVLSKSFVGKTGNTTQTYMPSDDGYAFYKVAIINRNFWKEVV